jgi:hypothetical protein
MTASPGTEDPIAALFDLADRVSEMGPTIRRMYRYTATVIVIFLAIMVFLLFVSLAGNFAFALLALLAIVFGAIALSLLAETDRFYRGFSERHRRLKLLQDAEPTPKIPTGRTALQRLVRYLARSNRRVGDYLAAHPESLRYRARVGSGPSAGPFDVAIVAPAGVAYRWFGLGDPGFVVLARVAPDNPTLEDLERFAADVGAAAKQLPARVARAILLRLHPEPMAEPIYEYAVGHPLAVPGGTVAVEVISEQTDGTYDLVPHVIGVP